MKILFRRGLTNGMLFVAAAVLIFEEWLWGQSKTLFARLARLPVMYSLETWIREYDSVVIFCACSYATIDSATRRCHRFFAAEEMLQRVRGAQTSKA